MKNIFIILTFIIFFNSQAQQKRIIYYSDFAKISINNQDSKIDNGYKVFIINNNKCISYLSDSSNFDNYENKEIILINKKKKIYSILLPPYSSKNIWKKYCDKKVDITFTDSSKTISNYNCKLAILKTKDSNINVWYTLEIDNNNWIFKDVFCKIPGTIIYATNGKKTFLKLFKIIEEKEKNDINMFDKYY